MVKNEKIKLLINVWVKIARIIGRNVLDFWQFFNNFLAFQLVTFQHFSNTIGTGLILAYDIAGLLRGPCMGQRVRGGKTVICSKIKTRTPDRAALRINCGIDPILNKQLHLHRKKRQLLYCNFKPINHSQCLTLSPFMPISYEQ